MTTMTTFKIGDFVTCTYAGKYAFTNDKSLCVVINELDSDGDIGVVVIGSNKFLDKEKTKRANLPLSLNSPYGFYVKAKNFKHITVSDWLEKAKTFDEVSLYENFYNIVSYYTGEDISIEGFIKAKKEEEEKNRIFAPLTLNPFIFSEEKKKETLSIFGDLYTKYRIDYDEKGINTQWEAYKTKAPLVALFAKHKDFDPNTLTIVKDVEITRSFNKNDVSDFCLWLRTQVENHAEKHQYKVNGMTYREAYNSYRHIQSIVDYMESINARGHAVKVDGMNLSEWRMEWRRLKDIYNLIDRGSSKFCISWDDYFVSDEDYLKYAAARDFIKRLKRISSDRLSQEEADDFNKIAAPLFDRMSHKGHMLDFGAREGMKISSIVLKFFKKFDLDKVEEWEEKNGRKVNWGWSRRFGDFCTAIKPVVQKRKFVLSLNPVDYLTASFGHGWGSCHTIDYLNIREADHTYSGMYRSGGVSYMGDPSTVVTYLLDPSYDGKEYWLEDKLTRTLFHVGENKFCQGRTYPDNRDVDDETSTAGQIRNIFYGIMEDIIKELKGKDFKVEWKHILGTSVCGDHMNGFGTNYRDPFEYEDCGISTIVGHPSDKKIIFGSDPVCPVCGRKHSHSGNITCCRSM